MQVKPGSSEKIIFKSNNRNEEIFFENLKEEYILSMLITGLKKTNIEITTAKKMLRIFSNADTRHLDKIVCENGRTSYDMHQLNLSFALPSDADLKMAKAKCNGEMLIVHFPKTDHPYCPPYSKIPVT